MDAEFGKAGRAVHGADDDEPAAAAKGRWAMAGKKVLDGAGIRRSSAANRSPTSAERRHITSFALAAFSDAGKRNVCLHIMRMVASLLWCGN